MKTAVFFLAAMAITVFATGQNQNVTNNVSVNPEFKCTGTIVQGTTFETIEDFLVNQVNYPFESIKCAKQGTEVISFTVTPEGEITNFKVINSICPKVDQEVIRVLSLTSGKWQSGTVNGVKVPLEKEVSIAFKMRLSNDFKEWAQSFLTKGINMQIKDNHKKAVRFYNEALNYMPNDKNILAARMNCKLEMGDDEGAEQDQLRLQKLINNENKTDKYNTEEIALIVAFK